MMRWGRQIRICAGAMLVIVGAVLSPPALAAGRPHPGGPVNAQLFAKASDGYEAELDSEGDKLRLSFSRGLLPSLIYTFHGSVTSEGIEARIADLGDIDLQFTPTPRKTTKVRLPSRCGEGTARATKGHFVGSIDFHAELGAVKLDVSRAEGWVTTPGWHCPATRFKDFLESQPPGRTLTVLKAEEKKRHLGFSAFSATDSEHPQPIGAEISAAMVTRRGPVTVDHLAVKLATNVFSFDSDLANATVTAPKPFQGQGAYCGSCAPGSRWTGDLRVSLPGIPGKVALAGSAFEANLNQFESGAGNAEARQIEAG